MDISIIIVNYNTTDHLINCLKSIIQFTKIVTCEIIVVDNNSPDREIENYPSLFPEVKFFFRKVNDGFGAGCNFGAMNAAGKYLAFVNPDILFVSDCLSGMFMYYENNPETGVCGPLLKDFDGNLSYIYSDFPDIKWEYHEATGKGNRKRMDEHLSVFSKSGKNDSYIEVDWLTGACILIKNELFKRLNGYDKDYFLYYEDTDLQFRIKNLGYKIICLKDFEVKHFINSSIRSIEGENIFYFNFNRSKLLYMYKHFSFLKRNIIRFMHIAGILSRLILLPLRKKFSTNKNQKKTQYKKMLNLYLSGYKNIVQSAYNNNL